MNLVLVGAGPVGLAVARSAISEGVGDRVTAVVDPDESARTKAAGELGASGFASVAELPFGEPGDAAIVTFTSDGDAAAAEIVRLVAAGYHAVTTCEELAAPDRHLAGGIATSAQSDDRVVIVTGANPGFIMDRLPVVIARSCRNVRSVTVERRVDTSVRRDPLITKTGYGLTPEEFAAGISDGTVGKVGLSQSARLLAEGLGWRTQDVSESIEPVLDGETVMGLHQRATLRSQNEQSIVLDLVLSWGAEDPHDEIHVDAMPAFDMRIDGGVADDEATVSQMIEALRATSVLDPGFYRPIDLPLTKQR